MLLDQYFTPSDIAMKIIQETVREDSRIKSFLDSSCGTGQLLHAADQIVHEAHCIGIDKDRKNILKLKRKQPDWKLSIADILQPTSYTRTHIVSNFTECDLLLLNPPFSITHKKFELIEFEGADIRCSLAMAHLIQSFKLFSPKYGAIVIVPESVLYSELDYIARQLLQKKYEIEKIVDLDKSTFLGASVHSKLYE